MCGGSYRSPALRNCSSHTSSVNRRIVAANLSRAFFFGRRRTIIDLAAEDIDAQEVPDDQQEQAAHTADGCLGRVSRRRSSRFWLSSPPCHRMMQALHWRRRLAVRVQPNRRDGKVNEAIPVPDAVRSEPRA